MPPAFLNSVESTAFSLWLRNSQSLFGYWFILSWHAIGMGLLVGASALIDLRLLGAARELPLSSLRKLYPIFWAGFWIQMATGIVLLIGYPTKSLMTPAFYVKLAFIAAATVVMVRLRHRLPSSPNENPGFTQGTQFAIWSLVLWFGAITAGRLIAYTAEFSTYPGGL